MSQLTNKRIVIVLPGFTQGGAERQALLLARYLHEKHQAQVQVWGLGSPGPVSNACDRYGLPWRIVRMGWPADRVMRVKAWTRFTLALRQARPDVILPYTIRPNVVCGLAWRFTGARLCLWQQRDEGRGLGVSRRVQCWAARQMPQFVSNSEHGKQFLITTLGVDAGRIQVIHNGIDPAPPRADRATWRQQLQVTQDCFLACMVANLHHYKDHATLLKAWRLVLDRWPADQPRPVLLLAGRYGNTFEALRLLAADLELGENVRFLGYVDDITGLLQAVDLGVFSSITEGVPNGLLECMAAGLPTTGTNSPGIREAVGPAGYPYLASPDDASGLAQQIVNLALDPKLRLELGEINRQRIMQQFSSRLMCEETTELIIRSLNSQQKRGTFKLRMPGLAQ